jgi:hypothetical protein
MCSFGIDDEKQQQQQQQQQQKIHATRKKYE